MPRIEKMFAFIVEDAGPGDEGVVGIRSPGGEWLPLVGADMKRVEALKAYARDVAARAGKPVRVLRFSVREELEVIAP